MREIVFVRLKGLDQRRPAAVQRRTDSVQAILLVYPRFISNQQRRRIGDGDITDVHHLILGLLAPTLSRHHGAQPGQGAGLDERAPVEARPLAYERPDAAARVTRIVVQRQPRVGRPVDDIGVTRHELRVIRHEIRALVARTVILVVSQFLHLSTS